MDLGFQVWHIATWISIHSGIRTRFHCPGPLAPFLELPGAASACLPEPRRWNPSKRAPERLTMEQLRRACEIGNQPLGFVSSTLPQAARDHWNNCIGIKPFTESLCFMVCCFIFLTYNRNFPLYSQNKYQPDSTCINYENPKQIQLLGSISAPRVWAPQRELAHAAPHSRHWTGWSAASAHGDDIRVPWHGHSGPKAGFPPWLRTLKKKKQRGINQDSNHQMGLNRSISPNINRIGHFITWGSILVPLLRWLQSVDFGCPPQRPPDYSAVAQAMAAAPRETSVGRWVRERQDLGISNPVTFQDLFSLVKARNPTSSHHFAALSGPNLGILNPTLVISPISQSPNS